VLSSVEVIKPEFCDAFIIYAKNLFVILCFLLPLLFHHLGPNIFLVFLHISGLLF
jgi:hypothetical protein